MLKSNDPEHPAAGQLTARWASGKGRQASRVAKAKSLLSVFGKG